METHGARTVRLQPGEGICTDMRAVRKDYFLDHDHSAYVDQWDWERVITAEQRNLDFLKDVVRKIWKVIVGAEKFAQDLFPQLKIRAIPTCPRTRRSSTPRKFWTCIPTCRASSARPRSCRSIPRSSSSASAGRLKTAIRTRCAPPTTTTGSPTPAAETGSDTHGLNGDILVWNHGHPAASRADVDGNPRKRRNPEQATRDVESARLLKFPYHQAIMNNDIPLSIGGGIGQSRTLMLLLRKAHLGEVSVTVWPKILKEMCAKKNIFVLE